MTNQKSLKKYYKKEGGIILKKNYGISHWAFGMLHLFIGAGLLISLILLGFDISPAISGVKETLLWIGLAILAMGFSLDGLRMINNYHNSSKKSF